MRALVSSRLLIATGLTVAATLHPSLAEAQDLAPPPPMDPTTPGAGQPGTGEAAEGAKLDKEEKKDSGRGLSWVYLDAHAGFSYVDMASFSATTFAVQKTSSEGAAFGFGAGIRLFILTLGAQATLNELADFSLWQVDAVLAFHIPIGHWEPYIGFHGGYAFVGTLDVTALSSAADGSPNVAVHGGDGGMQFGVDYFFNHYLSLGGEIAGNALFLHRPATALPAGVPLSAIPASAQQIYQNSGDSIGLGAIGSIHFGVHL